MHVYNVDPMSKNIEFNMNATVIILKGSAIIESSDGESILVEAPQLLRSALHINKVMSYFAEFSTDAKFMCNPNIAYVIKEDDIIAPLVISEQQKPLSIIPSNISKHRRHSSFALEEGRLFLLN